MKKSRGITLTMMTGLAAACSQQSDADKFVASSDQALPRQCVDSQNRIVGDSLCTNALSAAGTSQPSGSGGHGGGYPYPYFWYYGGGTSQGYMSGGTRTTLDAPAPTRAPVTRGGLGATAARRTGSIGA